MRSKEEREDARVRSLRTAARAYEIRAETERDAVKRGRLLMMRNMIRHRAETLARELEEK